MSYNHLMEKTVKIEVNWPKLGNVNASLFMERSLRNRNISNVYIFAGPDDVGKTTAAQFFASSLLCTAYVTGGVLPCGDCQACRQNKVKEDYVISHDFASIHPDFHLLKRLPDKKNISVEQVRDFIQAIEMSSFLNSFRVGIIKQADRLNSEAANALLKTLEEPKKDVVIILIVNDLENLPATILSRAQIVRFYPVKTEDIYHYLIEKYQIPRSQALHLSRIALGRPALAVKFLEDENFLNEYTGRLEAFLNFSKQSMIDRFNVVAGLLGDKATGQVATRRATRIIDTWQGLVRDLMLANYGHLDLVQHELIIDQLKEMTRNTVPERLITWLARFNEAKVYLNRNVSAKSVLEQLVSTI